MAIDSWAYRVPNEDIYREINCSFDAHPDKEINPYGRYTWQIVLGTAAPRGGS